MILDETPFNIREEIFYAVDLAKTNIGDKEIEISCLIDDKVPETIIGDSFPSAAGTGKYYKSFGPLYQIKGKWL